MSKRWTLLIALTFAATLAGLAVGQRAARPTRVTHSHSTQHYPIGGEIPAPPHPMIAPEDDALTISSHRIGTPDVIVDGRTVTLSCRADVFDRMPGYRYIWMTRVYTHAPAAERKLLHERHHVEHAFAMPEGQVRMAPEYRHSITLDPGEYDIQVALYSLAPGQDLGKLERGGDVRSRAFGWATTWVRVSVR